MATKISALMSSFNPSPSGVRRWLRLFPPVTLLIFLIPIAAGLVGTLLPSLGYLPGSEHAQLSLTPWRNFFSAPGVGHALYLTLLTGLGATILATLLAVAFSASWHGSRAIFYLRRWLAPLLASPHAAFAIGFAFLLAPSGWLIRAFSPWATGWERPPDFIFIQDPNGLALLVALVCKEIFFILLMIWSAMGQVNADRLLDVARTLGYRPVSAWCKIVLPLIYPQIRLPVYAVLAYSLSVADMAIILGPTAPPTLSVLMLTWFQDSAPAIRFQGAASAVFLLMCVIGIIAIWRATECLGGLVTRVWLTSGNRRFADTFVRLMSGGGMIAILAITVGSLLALILWSITSVWRFPDFFPGSFSLDTWLYIWPRLKESIFFTTVVAVVCATIAVFTVLGCLENELWNRKGPARNLLRMLYLPLLVPQISFLFGLQVVFTLMNIDGTWGAVVWSHLIFVLPYTFLVLSDPYRALDFRYARSASSLGASPLRLFWRIRAPLLLGAIAISFAVGFSVSVAQYLATLFPGVGRFPTLTTEAVIAVSGGDRRITAVFGLTQLILPLLVFAVAMMITVGRTRQFEGKK